MKRKLLKMLCILLGLLIFGTMIWGCVHGKYMIKDTYSDGIEQIDIDSIYLDRSDVQVDFSEVLIGKQEETRKLIVSTQEAIVSTELTERLIKKLDYKALKKTQKVTYTGKGYFVVDLDQLTKGHIIEDKKNKTLTIKIDHAYLQAIEIDPEKIIIGEVNRGWFTLGEIELTVKDYGEIEKELKNRLEKSFDTVENGQTADTIALQMVKEVYEPIVKAIDPAYEVYIEFR